MAQAVSLKITYFSSAFRDHKGVKNYCFLSSMATSISKPFLQALHRRLQQRNMFANYRIFKKNKFSKFCLLQLTTQ